MRTVLDLLVAMAVALLQFGAGVITGTSPDDIGGGAEAAEVEVVDLPDQVAEIVRWGVGRFEEAGLRLPPLRVESQGDDREACDGYLGIHRAEGEHSVIWLCTTGTGPVVERLVLHELAHAWLAHELSVEREAGFRALRGYEHWTGADRWHENGCEQAAEIVAWGLADQPVGVATILDRSDAALDAGFRALTGTAPIRPPW